MAYCKHFTELVLLTWMISVIVNSKQLFSNVYINYFQAMQMFALQKLDPKYYLSVREDNNFLLWDLNTHTPSSVPPPKYTAQHSGGTYSASCFYLQSQNELLGSKYWRNCKLATQNWGTEEKETKGIREIILWKLLCGKDSSEAGQIPYYSAVSKGWKMLGELW